MIGIKPRLPHVVFAIVAILSLLHAAGGVYGTFQNLFRHDVGVRYPFVFRGTSPVISTNVALPGSGNTLVSINGVPYQSYRALIEQVRKTHPGGAFEVTYLHPGSTQLLTARVPALPNPPQTTWRITSQAVFFLVPLACLLVGLYVLLARPLSGHAWLVFSVLAYFDTMFFPFFDMPFPIMTIAGLWAAVVQTAMPISLMLFGAFFPNRANLDRRVPWLKWVLLVPLLVLFPIDLLNSYSFIQNFALASRLQPIMPALGHLETILSILCVFCFFAYLFSQIRGSTGDARRRLRVLNAGAAAGMTPLLILVLSASFSGTGFGEHVPRLLFILALMAMLLFPLTLAYVVVVQRAMDLRILIHQGTKYFFARQSVLVIQVLAGAWFAFTFVRFLHHRDAPRHVDVVSLVAAGLLVLAVRRVLSRKLRQTIDRRFFREAYSTEQVLSELSDQVRNFTAAGPMLQTVSDRVGATLHVARISIFLRSGESFRLEVSTGEAARASRSMTLPAAGTTITALSRSREPTTVYSDRTAGWLVDATDTERAALDDLSAELLVPLPGRNRLIGVMTLGPKQSEQPYSATDRALLQTLASQTGLALENAELLETLTGEVRERERISREIEIAREVQERLFPQSYPAIPGVDMAGYCRPAQAVGGDYYDFFPIAAATSSTPRLGIAIGDISGKGISASLLMASLRASLRSLSRVQGGNAPDLATLMHTVNDLVYESSAANRYATFFFAEYDAATRVLTYVNAGHNPPYLLREQKTLALEATGMVIGLMPGVRFEQSSMTLQAGDVLLAYTDGISEAEAPDAEEWGEERMLAAAVSAAHQPDCNADAAHIVHCIMREADRFTGAAPQHDDMTLVLCRFLSLA